MENYIRVYDNAMSPEYCKSIVDLFEKNKKHIDNYDTGNKFYTEIDIDQWPDDLMT